MKFVDNVRFVLPRIGPTLADITSFLEDDLSTLLRDLYNGLRKLTIEENFQSFTVTVTIGAGATVTIPNQAKTAGWIPTKRLIFRSDGPDIIDGANAWTLDSLYIKNAGASAATATITFLK